MMKVHIIFILPSFSPLAVDNSWQLVATSDTMLMRRTPAVTNTYHLHIIIISLLSLLLIKIHEVSVSQIVLIDIS